jgi:hydrogenase expression/formation protein HypC
MCLAMPGMLLEIVDSAKRIGRVEISGTPRLVNLGILDEVAPGDWVLVQLGLAVEKIDAEAAQQAMCLLEELTAVYEQELAPTIREETER